MKLTESILKNLKEAVPVYYEDKRERKIPTGLTDDRAKDIINAVVGQLSDGIWENSPQMEKYWRNLEVNTSGSDFTITFKLFTLGITFCFREKCFRF